MTSSPLKSRALLDALVDLGLVDAGKADRVEAVSPSALHKDYSEVRSRQTDEVVLRRPAPPAQRGPRAASGRRSRLTTRELEAHLRKLGCEVTRQKGSHAIWRTPAGRTVPGPVGSGRRGGDSVTSAVLLVVRRVLRGEGLEGPGRDGDGD